MHKQVVVIASGATERAALPFLVEYLQGENIAVDVHIPSKNGVLTVDVVERLLKAAWYSPPDNQRIDKFVVLLDVDGKQPDAVVDPLRQSLISRLDSHITASVLFAYAQWHLEAWFFGDAQGLRDYLGRDLGSVDTSNPDAIENPKRHLINLLQGNYTRRVSEDIARGLNPQVIMGRSRSFQGFIDAVRNGDG